MTLKVIIGAILSITGIASTLLGIMFLIASREIQSRLISGLIMSIAGLVVLIIGIMNFRKGIRFSPSGIKKILLKLARMNNGELTEEKITGELGDSHEVEIQVAELVKLGIAMESVKGNRKFYIFKDFQVNLILKKCPYCGNDYPVRDDIERCPSCGGDLKMQKTSIAGNDDKFYMDEGE